MAIFGNKKNTKKKPQADASAQASAGSGIRASSAHVLRHARITEKATVQAEGNVYVFDVATSATKNDIARAIFDVYKVKPRMVRVAKVPSKPTRSIRTGIEGVKRGGKKAYVYLKAGETIS